MSDVKTPKGYDAGYAIVRYDFFLEGAEPHERFTVKCVVWDQEEADKEVERLNDLRTDSKTRYFWQYTRVKQRGMV
jgi:hypothetical protein